MSADILFNQGIFVGTPMVGTGNFPLDGNSIVAENADRLAYPNDLRYPGRLIHVEDTGEWWYLHKGIANTDWKLIGAGETPNIQEWQPDTEYHEGDIIWRNGTIWRVSVSHTSASVPDSPSQQELDDAWEDGVDNFESAAGDSYTNDTPAITGLGEIAAGTTFTNFTFKDFMDQQFYPTRAPGITLSASPISFGLFERGVAISNLLFTADLERNSYDLDSLEFFQNGTSLEVADTVPASGGAVATETPVNLTGLTNTTFHATVEDEEGLTASAQGIYEFVNPVFIGYLGAAITAATADETMVKGMTKRIAKPGTQTMNYTFAVQKIAFWIPSTWGSLTTAFDQNNFNITAGFESAALPIENAAGETVNGTLYIARNATTTNGFLHTFNFG